LGVDLPVSVSPGTAIEIQLADAIILGEAVYTRPEGSGFYTGIHLNETLSGLAELARIVQAFEEELQPQTFNSVRNRRQQD